MASLNKAAQIYLDHGATTPVDPAVVEAMIPCFSGTFGNASSIHSFGQSAKVALEAARRQVAELIGAEPGRSSLLAAARKPTIGPLRGARCFSKAVRSLIRKQFFQRPEDQGQRRAELVGDIGKKA